MNKVMVLLGVMLLGTGIGYGEDKKASPKPTCSYGETEFVGGLDGFCEETGPGQFHLVFKDRSGEVIVTIDWPGDLKDPPAMNCQELCEAGAMGVAYDTDRLVIPKRREKQKKSQGDHSKGTVCKVDADCPARCETCRSGKQACFEKKGCMDCDPRDDRTDCLPGHFCRWDEKSGGYKCRP